MPKYRPITEFFHNGSPLVDILNEHEKWVKHREGKKADLIGAELVNIDLSDTYLRGCDLIKANLHGANLQNANLGRANLFGATLNGANLRGVNLRRANLEKARMMETDLDGAILSEANLKSADLAGARMDRVEVLRANLEEANLTGAVMRDADLYKSDLQGAKLIGAHVERTKMKRANLQGADLTEAYLREAEMPYAELSETEMKKANLENCHMHSVNLRDANLNETSLIGADLTGSILSGVLLDQTNISEWIITGVTCTHIFRGEKRKIVKFSPEEFEKKYSQPRNTTEMILNVPLTGSAYYIGKFITRSMNNIINSHIIDFKGVELLSDTDTKYFFNFIDEAFFEKNRETFEINLRYALNGYFRHNRIAKNQSYLGGVLEDATKGAMGRADRIDPVPDAPWEIDAKVKPDSLIEHYNKLEKIGKSIYNIVASVFRKDPAKTPIE
ncbi:MAG: pentapeptide repeat-containing protein [Deltaproteobacteria bacterium]|nr:pentapeptide repeat-containing protein [Deltaproteobacteria bacterium]MBW1941628.1 pentapeptide repeat-containing protein [Deltaproteobacteria bacterium]MBW2206653.1 pentapeptide repeat-containing protein [Deltaproteobacteria bacterium]